MGRLLALVAALIAGVLLAWASQRLPAVAPASAPAQSFSADRAMADVRAIARTPHPIGSAANAKVRDHLIGRMTALGLRPQVHRGAAFALSPNPGRLVVFGGQVENLIGVLPGRDRTAPAVALMAHYDSVPGSPGAADDAAGVAAALEAVRAIQARGQPARDVMVVLTDGEEAGLLGANGFFRDDPLAKRIGLALNMEARGGGGRVQMFETSAQAGGLIGLVRQAGARPQAGSLTGLVYRLMPNSTDFTLAAKAGVAGLNYAFLDRQFDYHSATSTADRLQPGTLQELGDQVLGAAGRAAFATALPVRAPDRIYSQVFGDLLIAYPPLVGWLLLAATALLIAVGVVRALRLEAIPAWDVARGGGALLAMAVTGASVLHLARKATGVGVGYLEQRPLLAHAEAWELAVMVLAMGVLLTAAGELARGRYRFALLPLAAGLGAQAFGGLDVSGLALGAAATVLALVSYGRPSSRSAAWIGVLGAGLLLSVVVMALAPAASYALAWPLLLAAVAAVATGFNTRSRPAALALIAAIAAVGLGWIGGMAHMIFVAVDLPPLLAAPMLMAALLIWPLAQPAEGAPPERLLGPALLAAGLMAVILIRGHHGYDARHPQATSVTYQLDQEADLGWRVTTMPERAAWTDGVLGADGGKIAAHRHWAFPNGATAAAAPYLALPGPQIILTPMGDGRVRLTAMPPPGARTLVLRLKPDTPARIEAIAGLPASLRLNPVAWSVLRWEAAQTGFDLVIRPAGPGTLTVRYAVESDAWPSAAKPLPPRPAEAMAFDVSDGALITGTRRLAW